MKRTILCLLVILIMSMAVSIYGQVSAYVFSSSTGSYSAITGGTVLGTATSGGSGNTALDAINYNLPSGTIPFAFKFNGVDYTGMNVRTDGYITFGTTAPSSSGTSPISASTTYDGAISPMGYNLQGSVVSSTLGELR